MLLHFEQADRYEDVVRILDEAAAWLAHVGISQWPERFSDQDGWRQERLAKYVHDGSTWLVCADRTPVATFTLTDSADPDFARGWPSGTNTALYIFRMAVRREWSGHALGTHILNWSSARAHAQGYEWLRLDCSRENRRLQRYYEHRGFVRVGTEIVTIEDHGRPYTRGSGALYQRVAGSQMTHEGDAAMTDPYDPSGHAAIWQEAANMVMARFRDDLPEDSDWNTALEQASRALETRCSQERQAQGMYYRVIDGSGAC